MKISENLENKIKRSKGIIAKTLERFNKPCVLWSAGKDSTVLLYLLLEMGKKPPVVCWREPWMPEKLTFTNKIIQIFGLEVYDYAPSKVELCEGNGRIDVLNYYQTGPASNPMQLILARGTEEPEPDKHWLCGVDTFLSRPLGTFNFPWDVAFHGHKSTDEDPTSGPIPLEVDIMFRPNAASASFPLRDWTDDDIFEYIKAFQVPFDESRYFMDKDGNWIISKNKDLNPDYYHTCFDCVKRSNPDFVICPKNGLSINNVSEHVIWSEPKAAYANLRTG